MNINNNTYNENVRVVGAQIIYSVTYMYMTL